MMNKSPIAVLISDIHFNINTLSIASYCLEEALAEATFLNVPLIIAGDLHDTKAIIRAEVANTLLEQLDNITPQVYILVGNHDRINEKFTEHGLSYLNNLNKVTVIDRPQMIDNGMGLIPYCSSKEDFLFCVQEVKESQILVVHQGFMGANMGDYIQDKSSVDPALLENYTVFSGHYHRHQQLYTNKLKEAMGHAFGQGTVTYIGNPYTLSFGEANDGPKGFLVLNSDGSFTQRKLHYRKHIIVERSVDDLHSVPENIDLSDLLWLKVTGPRSLLQQLNKKEIGERFIGHSDYKLDLIPNDSDKIQLENESLPPQELFEKIIDSTDETETQKIYLKELFREIISS